PPQCTGDAVQTNQVFLLPHHADGRVPTSLLAATPHGVDRLDPLSSSSYILSSPDCDGYIAALGRTTSRREPKTASRVRYKQPDCICSLCRTGRRRQVDLPELERTTINLLVVRRQACPTHAARARPEAQW